MRVIVRFVDGEVMEGQSEAANLQRMGFPVSPAEEANNEIAWVSLASIKYVLFPDSILESSTTDPREQMDMTKVVLHFSDGEIMRTYKDDTFQQDSEGFNLRIWDQNAGGLIRVIVSLHALKAIFFVKQWDSRTDQENQLHANPDENLPEAGAGT